LPFSIGKNLAVHVIRLQKLKKKLGKRFAPNKPEANHTKKRKKCDAVVAFPTTTFSSLNSATS